MKIMKKNMPQVFNPRSSCEERPFLSWMQRKRLIFSIHAPSCEERPDQHAEVAAEQGFSIHAPLARSDVVKGRLQAVGIAFQSTLLLRGATRAQQRSQTFKFPFQSTLLLRGATFRNSAQIGSSGFQSTLLLRGATESELIKAAKELNFSIHAPLARSDIILFSTKNICGNFHPRSSCEERHIADCSTAQIPKIFNPRSSCEERLLMILQSLLGWFSIHAPLARSDWYSYEFFYFVPYFQSTLLLRGATTRFVHVQKATRFSIHAPLARSDAERSVRRQIL